MFPKVGQKIITFVFTEKVVFNKAHKSPDIWTTFVRIFFTRNFQKSPNLVTLITYDCPFQQCDHIFKKFFKCRKALVDCP